MKKITLFIIAFVFVLSLGQANAWDRCYKDVNYTPELWLNIEGPIIRGQAFLEGHPSFPAPITGYVRSGRAFFTIAYLGDDGVRFYEVSASNGAGTTWGIINATAEYYDTQHSAALKPCALSPEEAVSSGANE